MTTVDFDRPPVAEVAIGAQFQPISGLGGVQSGSLWQRWSPGYPSVSEQPWLPRWPDLQQQGTWFSFGAVPVGVRTWFLDPTQDHVLQLQNDRLIANWRKISGVDYPRYPEVLGRFRAAWADVQEYARDAADSELDVDQIEVSYINNIDASPARVLRGWDAVLDGADWSQNNINLVRQVDCTGASDARLIVTIGGSSGDQAFTSLTLTVRAVPTPSRDPLAAIGGAHDLIVQLFRDMTTEPMHQEWRVK